MHVEVQSVSKTYGRGKKSVAALDGVTLDLDAGLFGLLGPNGAGKSTLMKILATLLRPTSGRVLVDGRDALAEPGLVRRRLGYLGQDFGVPRSARCSEVIDLVLRLRGQNDAARRRMEVERLLGQVGLTKAASSKAKTLSGGMMRRLGVAQALAGDPDLLIMDEPTVGLDPDERIAFRNLLGELARERTILLSTHVVADIGSACDDMAVLSGGRVAFRGAPLAFTARAEGHVFEVLTADAAEEDRIRLQCQVVASHAGPAGHVLRVVGPRPQAKSVASVPPTLEDAYLLLVGAEGGVE